MPRTAVALALLAAFAYLAAQAIIPLRLRFGEQGSPWTFGYLGDEYVYAWRAHQLPEGTTALNQLNGIADEHVRSPYLFEDLTRVLVGFSGLSIFTVGWLWRWLLPAALLGAWYLALRAMLRRDFAAPPGAPLRAPPPWPTLLLYAALAATGQSVLYECVTVFPPMQGFILRFPTGFEYLLAPLLAERLLAFAHSGTLAHGLQLALLSAVGALLRPYLVLPWIPVVVATVLWAGFTRRASLLTLALTALTVLACVAPYAWLQRQNAGLRVAQEMHARYFHKVPYYVNDAWPVYLAFALLFVLLGWRARGSARMLAFSAVPVCAALPFVLGLFPFAYEVVFFDRFGSFYLIAFLLVGLQVLAESARTAPGRWNDPRALAVAACAFSATLAAFNLQPFTTGPLPSVRADLVHVPAYQWVERNTPPGALFIVDDGVDYGVLPPDPLHRHELRNLITNRDDLFMLIARRPRVFVERIYTCPISNKDMEALMMLHRGTLGLRGFDADWRAALLRFRPRYVLWKKPGAPDLGFPPPPVPRGLGKQLLPYRSVVYADEATEIWELRLPESFVLLP